MSLFQLTRKAEADLKGIGRYTQKTRGRKQRNVYLSGLDKCFHLLADEPDLGLCCDEVKQGYRKFYKSRHVIFYRKVDDKIEIVRVLHERMDAERHL
ncbi:MAG: type II toxin-antitoxin system RelE/ParE family toxin [Methylococcaceae bacterium]|nr:type II toxin-antitoxin system RelE/ParE family toxin [Methylococcaceae bacterium]